MTKPTLVFDLDGTLIDTAPDILGTLDDILTREGIPLLPHEEALAFIGIGSRAMLERALVKSGEAAGGPRLDALFKDFLTHYATRLAVKSRPFPGAVDALTMLKAQGFKVAICTNKMEQHSLSLIDQIGLAPMFDAICGRDTFEFCKPDGRHISATVARAGGDVKRAIMIGDTITDFHAARNAGVPSIGVRFGYSETPIDDLGPTEIIESFDELLSRIDAVLARFYH